MKKKLGIIIAALLCVVLIFTFVACKKKTETTEEAEPTVTVSAEAKSDKQAKLDTFIDAWLLSNAEEAGNVTDQKKGLKTDLEKQKNSYAFTVTDSSGKKKTVKWTAIDVKFTAEKNDDGDTIGGTYDITIKYTGQNLESPVEFKFTKKAKTVDYGPWAGTKVKDEWLAESFEAFGAVDKIVAAGVKTVNKITGNGVTGKFGADGTVGINIGGKSYALRVKGNVDLTKNKSAEPVGKNDKNEDVYEYTLANKAGNEVGVVIVNQDGDEIAGLFYDAAADAKNNKLYVMYPSIGDDGKLVRKDGEVVHSYKYIEYADILGLIEDALPDTYPEANGGVLSKDKNGNPVQVNGLISLLKNIIGLGDGAQYAEIAVNMVAKPYEIDGAYYVDINLGSLVSQVSTIMAGFGEIKLDFLDALDVDLANLSGLLGHITLGGKVDQTTGELTSFELAVNIPKCTFYRNAKRGEDDGINIPAISFAIFIDDFSFLTTGAVENVIPAEATREAAYFSPADIDVSGDLYVEFARDGETRLDKTFHFDLVTDINPLEIATNNEEMKIAFVVLQHSGDVSYTDANKGEWTNFLSVTYQQAKRLLCISGTALEMGDDGETIYKLVISSKKDVETALKKWLGIDNWQGLDFDETLGLIIDNEAIAKESAKALLQNTLAENLMKYVATVKKSYEKPVTPPAGAGFEIANIGEYFSAFSDLYDKYVEEEKITYTTEPFSFGADIDLAMIKEVVETINDTFGTEFDPELVTDPQYVRIFANTEGYTDKTFIATSVKGVTYELTFDDSQERKFVVTFKMTLKSGRTYTVSFDAVKDETRTTWSATVVVDIKAKDSTTSDTKTTVKLSGFTFGEWGKPNTTKLNTLLAAYSTEAEDAALIFPADGNGPVTAILPKIVELLNNENIESYVEDLGKEIIDANGEDWFTPKA